MKLLIFCALFGLTFCQGDWELVFEDEFDTLDFETWEHEKTMGGGGNWEFQVYSNNRSNSYVRDGILYIKPTLTEDMYGEGFISNGRIDMWGASPADQCTGNAFWGCDRSGNPDNYINPAMSARLRSARSFAFQYGRVEVRARMPKGDWLWPAIWMLPKHNEYGQWPSSGEIDLVESRGNLDLRDESGNPRGHQWASQTMHWGPYFETNRYYLTDGGREGTFADEFHLYELEWTPESITLSMDGTPTFTVDPGNSFWDFGDFPDVDNPWVGGSKMAPFDRPFYLLFNVAVGGTNGFFSDSWTNMNGPKPWTNPSPFAPREFWLARNDWLPTWNGEDVAMAVDYVRVYEDRTPNK